MKKNEGIITIEATVSLTAFLFCVLFFLNFAKVYMAQNMVAYGAMEACKQYSIDYYKASAWGNTQMVSLWAKVMDIWVSSEDPEAGEADMEAGDVLMIGKNGSTAKIEEYFAKSISGDLKNSGDSANEYLKGVGIKGGMAGLDFSGTALVKSENKIRVTISYKVNLPFPFFGIDTIDMEEQAESRLWKFTKLSNG